MSKDLMLGRIKAWQSDLKEMIHLAKTTEQELLPLLKQHEKALEDFIFLIKTTTEDRAGHLFSKAEPLGNELARKVEKIREGIRNAKIKQ